MQRFRIHLLLFSIYLLWSTWTADAENTSYSWKPNTPLVEIMRIQEAINNLNCHDKSKERLRLSQSTVSQVPKFNKIPTTLFFPNRTGLLHVHNMALNRAFFYSYVLQYFNVSQEDFSSLPGLLYTYLSVASDVSANPDLINGSTLLYDVNSFYPNWFVNLPFNKTLNLFGVRAIRSDDTQDGDNFLREPTLNTIQVFDIGAQDDNYTARHYRNAPWYGKGPEDPKYMPDKLKGEVVGGKKHSFKFTMHWNKDNMVGHNFFGPPYAGQLEDDDLPVRFTAPWFDCGATNRAINEWLVSAVSPLVDFIPRYGRWRHLQYPKYVAVAAMDTFFTKIPVNLCPISVGNPRPNLLAGSDLCHKSSTICESLYLPDLPSQLLPDLFRCRCKPEYSDAFYQHIGFVGTTIGSQTTREEYESDSYRCERIGNLMFWPTSEGITPQGAKDGRVSLTRRKRSIETYEDEQKYKEDQLYRIEQEQEREKEEKAWQHIRSVLREEGLDSPSSPQTSHLTSKHDFSTRRKQTSYTSRFDPDRWQNAESKSKLRKRTNQHVSRHQPNQQRREQPQHSASHISAHYDDGHRFDSNWLEVTESKLQRQKRAVDANKSSESPDPSLSPAAATNPTPDIGPTTKPQDTSPPQQSTASPGSTDAPVPQSAEPLFIRAKKMVEYVKSVNRETCKSMQSQDLVLPGTVSFGAETQFKYQAATALRLAHFLSAFLQTVGGPDNIVASLRLGQLLHEQHVIGEVMANVAGDTEIVSSSVLFRRDFFIDSKGKRREQFGPTAYKEGLVSESFNARDLAGYGGYLHLPWYRELHDRWATNPYGLKRFRMKGWIRPNPDAKHLLKHLRFPLFYRAPRIGDGYWSRPHFDCYGPVPDWLITYAAPFFSRSSADGRLEFAGVASVSVRLSRLNINQCDFNFDAANFFKDSHACDRKSTECKHMWGMGFSLGNYECHCSHNTEFPFKGERYFYLGSMMERHYVRKLRGESNYFDVLKCREGVAGQLVRASGWTLLLSIALIFVTDNLQL